jgi:hypothetical protein
MSRLRRLVPLLVALMLCAGTAPAGAAMLARHAQRLAGR